ncbi:MAG: chorismate mutase, partial [Kiritimatiellae bacterium]|nr:chorismate mutase [Kiritimatiellia bacterium]
MKTETLNETDAIDDEIARLFQRRMELAGEGAPDIQDRIDAPARERATLARVTAAADPKMLRDTCVLFNTIFGLANARR